MNTESYNQKVDVATGPGPSSSDNGRLIAFALELHLEELEPVIAPGLNSNHNESFVAIPTKLAPSSGRKKNGIHI